jgi:hypothetical protein
MSIQYVSTNRQNTTFVPTNKQDLINNIETVLLAAGWTTISGHATTTLVMQSATTPQGLNMQLKAKDNGGTCVTLSIQNVSGTKVGNNSTTQGAQLNPGASSKTYRMVANKYQAFIWTPTPTPAREYAAWGVPYLPSFLVGVVTEAIWLQGNSITDTNTSVLTTFRTKLGTVIYSVGSWGASQQICNGNIWEVISNSGLGTQMLVQNSGGASGSAARDYRWHDGSANICDALISWGLTAETVEGKIAHTDSEKPVPKRFTHKAGSLAQTTHRNP